MSQQADCLRRSPTIVCPHAGEHFTRSFPKYKPLVDRRLTTFTVQRVSKPPATSSSGGNTLALSPRTDIDMIAQQSHIRRVRGQRLLDAHMADFATTCANRDHHRRFVLALVGEAYRYRAHHLEGRQNPAERPMFVEIYRSHEVKMLDVTADRYAECLGEVHKLRAFDLSAPCRCIRRAALKSSESNEGNITSQRAK